MSDQNLPNPFGDPEPVQRDGGSSFILTLTAYVALVCGGVVAFATLVRPTRCQGATSSGRLQWQQCQQQMREELRTQTTEPIPAPAEDDRLETEGPAP